MKILRFYTEGCGPCKVLAQNIEQLINNSSLTDFERVPVIPVNARVDVIAKEKYGITEVPTLVAVNEAGVMVNRISGFTGAANHIAWFNAVGDTIAKERAAAEAAAKAARGE